MNAETKLLIESFPTRKKLNSLGIERQTVRAEFEDPLTAESVPVIPDGQEDMIEDVKLNVRKLFKDTPPSDIEVMYMGKMCSMAMDFQVRSQNALGGMMRSYGVVEGEVNDRLQLYAKLYQKDFEESKARATKVIKYHPLAQKLCVIKGFTPYSLGLLMSYIKDIKRFKTPAALCTYGGTVPKYGIHVSKKNIKEIREIKHREMEPFIKAAELDDAVDETMLKEFGYNTRMQQRLFNLQESFLRAGGFFLSEYRKIRPRLEERAMTAGECFQATAEDVKESKGVMELGKYYMTGRKNQSLIMWSHRNACWRITRIFLHILHHEWSLLEGVAPRIPYAVEYLGHQRIITLQDVVDYETKK